ncbi:unnamed protein product [Mytilus coruscus]|uniref:Uncharacterized protein n=1 Tax=Mytilus coruscus TaxID=42192 RepID=A0A6J8EQJ1_MYTCO|nr:unnamed protein product [Mytilus coruscus]
MSIPNFVSVILIFCFTLSTFPTINGEPVNCETQNKTACCNYVECSYINCTNATDENVTHEGCHAKVNITKLDGVCKKNTVETICSGPDAANKCSLVGNETACCNTTINPGCAWLGACANTSVQLGACYNATDLPKLCNKYTDSCKFDFNFIFKVKGNRPQMKALHRVDFISHKDLEMLKGGNSKKRY